MFMIFIDVSNNPDAILDQQAIDNEFYAAALRELVSLGLDVTRIVHQQIVAHSIDSPHSPVPEATSLAYERVTRALRRAIMLAKRHNALPRKTPEPQAKPAPKPGATPSKDAEHPDRPDRPDSPDRLDTLEDRPTIELINELRQDLGHPPIDPPNPSAVARIAPSRCGTTSEDETNAPQADAPNQPPKPQTQGPPYPPGS